MKKFFTDLKQKLGTVATEQLESHRPGTLSELDAMGRRAAQHTAVLRQALSDRATDAKAMAQRVAGDEHVRQAVDRISAGFDSVRNGVAATASSVASSIATASASKAKGAGPAGGPTDERGKLSAAIKKLRARDTVGVSAEVLATAGGAAAGAAAAGTVPSVAGASTLLGSSVLGSAFGGIFVATTPVGWVVGSAVLVGAAGYGLTKLARSGAQQDRLRREIVERLARRLESLNRDGETKTQLTELTQLVTVALAAGLITDVQGQRMVDLVERGSLEVEVAVRRLKDLALARGAIETVTSSAGNTSYPPSH